MNWILFVVIGIVAVLGWLGWKKGLVKMVFSLASTIIALLVAMLFSPIVAGVMKNSEGIVTFFDEKIGTIIDFTPEEAEETDAVNQKSLVESLPLPRSIKETILENNNEANYLALNVGSFEQYVCRQITNVIINAIAFVITLIVASIALFILCNTLNVLAKLPLLRQINEVAGLAAGVAEGILLVWILFVVLTMFATSAFGSSSLELIAENPVLDFLYKNNLVSTYITRG